MPASRSSPRPPVARRDCFEVAERIDASGNIILPLDETMVRSELIPALASSGYDAVAICLLSAYVAPAHEQRLKAMIAVALPGLRIACSHEVAREFRGGMGFLRRFEILADEAKLALYSDRLRRPPDGLFGGEAGSTGYCEIRRGGQPLRLRSKDEVQLQRGDIVMLAVGGGGGYGDPARRAAARIADDVADGYVAG